MASSVSKICDPHFHYWDLVSRPNVNLAGLNEKLPHYNPDTYKTDAGTLPIVCGVHVEATVGQSPEGGDVDFLGETKWVNSLASPAFPTHIVAYAHLLRDDTDAVLAKQAAEPNVVGIRMILNHHPTDPSLTWPQVERDFTTHEPFRAGFAKLATHNLSFDFQANPHQLKAGAAIFAEHPAVPVIVNHMGCLKLGVSDEADAALTATWREGIAALAAVPHVFMKLSMFSFMLGGWEKDDAKEAIVKKHVLELIEAFGADRCMFASNYPVDKLDGVAMDVLYAKTQSWVAHLPADQQAALFHDTAAKVYKLDASPAK